MKLFLKNILVIGVASTAMNCGGGRPDCAKVTETVTYNNQVVTIMQNHCIQCHEGSKAGSERHGAPTDVDYGSYDQAKANGKKGAQQVHDEQMPPDGNNVGAKSVSNHDSCILDAWVAQGMLEQ